MPGEVPFKKFSDARAWEKWLVVHHGDANDAWLLIGKKGGGGGESLLIGDALDVALCYGWIDSHRRGYDKTHYLQRYSPRRARSPWSKLNVQRAEALVEAGRMQASGLKEIAAAMADGRWAVAYERQRDAVLPSDVATALAGSKRACDAFAGLSKSDKYVLVLPVLKATSPEIRTKRIKSLVASLDRSKAD